MPGTFIFAALGVTCIILFLINISIIPINYLALLLILAGIALVIAEVFILSFGLLTLSVIISLATGLCLFFERGYYGFKSLNAFNYYYINFCYNYFINWIFSF